jgi:GNAT superfamily N-acetyltransferase
MHLRPIEPADREQWEILWEGYNAFYGRSGANALLPEITELTWNRFFDDTEPVQGIVADHNSELVGIVHFIFHRSTTRATDVCYLQDLFTAAAHRGRGIGRAMIEAVYHEARGKRAARVYWQTQATNTPGRMLYDKVAEHHGFIVYAKELGVDGAST